MTLLFEIMCVIDFLVLVYAVLKGFFVTFSTRTKDSLMGDNFLS